MTIIWRNCLILLLLISLQFLVHGQDNAAQEVAVEVGENSEQQFEYPSTHPFFEAVVSNDIEGIDALLKEGVTVDYQNENGWTPAIYAVEYHKYDSLLKIIDSGADLNIQERDGWTALMFAAFHGDGAMVELLLEHNSSPIQANIHGALPYQIARAQQHLSEASVLHDAAVVHAMEMEDEKLLMNLIRDEGKVNIAAPQSGWTPLIFFAAKGFYDECLELIGIGADVDQAEADGWNPLLFSASNGHVNLVSILLESGANVNYRALSGVTPLSKAREGGFSDIEKLLLARGATEEGEEAAPEPHDEEENVYAAEEAVFDAPTDAETAAETESAETGASEALAAEEFSQPFMESVGEPVRTADSITHDPNPPGELDLTRKAVEEDFAKHKKRKGLFFW